MCPQVRSHTFPRGANPLISHRRVLLWAAMGFSVLWGAVFGLAITKHDTGLAIFGAIGMALTVVLTVLLYRQQTQLRNLVETDSLTEDERPRTRTEINRARIAANQLARVIESFRAGASPRGPLARGCAAAGSRAGRCPACPTTP